MIARWILYGLGITTLLALAAILAERIATVLRVPRRFGWGAALFAAIVCTAAAPWRDRGSAGPAVKPPSTQIAVFESGTVAFTPGNPSSLAMILERGQALVSSLLTRAAPAEPLLRAGWLLGALLLVLTYLLGVVVLARRRRTWIPREVDGVDVLVAQSDGPAVLGLLHPRIVLPEWALTLDGPSRALMIRHECEHLRARDPVLLHAASLALVLMPWNAPAWWIVYRLRLAVELDCDARVLRDADAAPTDAPRYGQLLLDVASHRSPGSIRIAPALLEHTSSLSRRIAAMYPDRLRFPRMQGALAAASTVCLLVLAAEVPVPRLSAQEPSIERLVGSATVAPAPNLSVAATRALLQKYYPDVLRGEGPRSVAFVRDLSGRVIGAMSAHDAEALIGEIRGRQERREEPSTGYSLGPDHDRVVTLERRTEEPARAELRANVERDVATTVERKVEEASRAEAITKTERIDAVERERPSDAVVRERVERDLVRSLEFQLKAAQDAVRENSSSEREGRVKLAEGRLREAQQKLAESLQARDPELRQKTEEPRDRILATRVPVSRMEEARAERNLGSLAERTVAIDVVRHASGLFGREPVNVFFVTRNGPN